MTDYFMALAVASMPAVGNFAGGLAAEAVTSRRLGSRRRRTGKPIRPSSDDRRWRERRAGDGPCDLGISMGAAGTDAALEAADIALMGDDLLGVAWLVQHAHRTLAIIGQNIFASLGVKLILSCSC